MKKGWLKKRLGDFAVAVSTGPFGSILHKSDYADEGVPLVNPINIVGDSIVPDPSKLISAATIKRLSNYVLNEGDVVVGRRGEIGRCAVVGPNEIGWVCGTGSFFIRPLPTVDSKFLAHLIRSADYREKLEQLSTGATMKNLSNTALGDLVIEIPTLTEQRRIVGILDKAFEGIATVKTNAEKNLKNSRALFDSYLQSVFTQHGGSWVWCRLGEKCKFSSGGTPSKSNSAYWKGSIPWVSGRDMKKDRIGDAALHISKAAITESAARIAPVGALLILVRGMGLANGIAVAEVIAPCAFNQDIRAIQPDSDIDPRFLRCSLRFTLSRSNKILNKAAHGTLKINMDDLQSVAISIPPLTTQRQIVSRIDSFSSETQCLASLYQKKLAALEALRKSLLHQAFAGEL